MPICELYHDNFQNYKCYGIPHAQLVIADIPYNIGANAYASNPVWYNGGDNKNGESKLAKRDSYGFEVDRKFYAIAKEKMLDFSQEQMTFEEIAT